MSASTFKRFNQFAIGAFDSVEAAASPAAAKFGAAAAQASAGMAAADAAGAISFHAAAASAWSSDAKAVGLAAVPW